MQILLFLGLKSTKTLHSFSNKIWHNFLVIFSLINVFLGQFYVF